MNCALCRLCSARGEQEGPEYSAEGGGTRGKGRRLCCRKLKSLKCHMSFCFKTIVRDHFTNSLTCNKGRMAPLPLIGCSGFPPPNSGCLPSTFSQARDSTASFDGNRTCTVSLWGHNFVFSTLKQLIRDVAVSSAPLVNLALRLWLRTSKRLTRVPIFFPPLSKTLTPSKPMGHKHPV